MNDVIRGLVTGFRRATDNQIENLHHNLFVKGVRVLCGEEAPLFVSDDGGA
jgi:hypothetical protein